MLFARPHLNGNTPADFRRVAEQIEAAVDQLDAALKQVACDVTHGRNYQHAPIGSCAQQQRVDHARLRKLQAALTDFQQLSVDVAEQAGDR